jgi:hypothetical protein
MRRLAVSAIAKLAIVCTFSSLISAGIFSQSVSSPSSAEQLLRRINVGGVENIAGQPFSADLEIEHTQTLPDGSHIHTVQHEKLYRDGEGRIRSETYNHQDSDQQNPEELTTVTITDSPENVRYNLQPRNRTAQRSTIFGAPLQTQAAQRQAPVPAQQTQPRRKFTSEALGTQTIEGVAAEGTRYSTTYPVNFMGNDAPLVNTGETWSSTEMGLQIVQKTNDPRTGETVRRFTHIQRGEQDPSLFQVPADYTIRNPQ